jgi:hypothetical protein
MRSFYHTSARSLPRVAHLLNMEIPDGFDRLILDSLVKHNLAT